MFLASSQQPRPRSSSGKALQDEWRPSLFDANIDTDENESSEQALDPTDLDEDSESLDVEVNFVKAISLSSLIHPVHETRWSPSNSPQDTAPSNCLLDLVGAQNMLMDACNAWSLTIQGFQRLTDAYFDNMTAFSLFHRPSFGQKIQNIKDPVHFQALFAAMFSFASKFTTSTLEPLPSQEEIHAKALTFHNQAKDLIAKSFNENSDQPPSLCLLQAMTITAFTELTKGVRAQAWRLLGSCVRMAYELHMHLIDYEARNEEVKVGRDLARWTADEERRRCWWAIWEMDNFASTIRRCPTAIDWTMIDTYLPVQDDYWFNNQYQPSGFLDLEPDKRWKVLDECGNESPNAWLIVISSIMRNAQVLLRGNLHGVLLNSNSYDDPDQLHHYFRNSFRKNRSYENASELEILIRALQNVIVKLPDNLNYQGEYLDFGSNGSGVTTDFEIKRLHSAKYNVYLTFQLARFMIYHHYAFEEIVSGTIFSEKKSINNHQITSDPRGLSICLQAADDICALIERCSNDHVKHVNPFLASTVWLAASLQVLRRVAGENHDDAGTNSKCMELRAACEHFTKFWQAPSALLENLDSLEERLRHYRYSSHMSAATAKRKTRSPSTSHLQNYRDSSSRRLSSSKSSSGDVASMDHNDRIKHKASDRRRQNSLNQPVTLEAPAPLQPDRPLDQSQYPSNPSIHGSNRL